MKCPSCGKEIPDNSKFCDYCGKPVPTLPSVSQDVLVELAEGYVANTAAAKEIANQASTKPDGLKAVREYAISYLQKKETDLFQEKPTFTEGKEELTSIENLEDALRPLTYEERIVVLMKNIEKLSVEDIAQDLSISIEEVHGYLQSAFEKVYPEGKIVKEETSVVKEEKVDPVLEKAKKKGQKAAKKTVSKPKKPKNGKNYSRNPLSTKVKIVVAVVVACVLGGWLGIKNFANGQYEAGVESLKNENYEEAIKEFSNAVQWWSGKEDANKQLAYAYAGDGNYEKAAEKMETYIEASKDTDMNLTLASYYSTLGKESVDKEDYKSAAEWYEKAYSLDQSPYTNMKLLAAQNEGSYTDESGNEYNKDAQLTKINVKENGYSYSVSLDYEDGKLTSMQAKMSNAPITFNKFQDTYESAEIAFYPVGNTLRYYVHETVNEAEENYYGTYGTYLFIKEITKDSDGNITKVRKENQKTGEVLTSEYTYIQNVLASIKTTTNMSEDAWIEEFTYDDNGNLVERTIARNLLSTVEHETYTYDESGNCTRKITERNEITAEENLAPYADYRITDYTYTNDGELYSATVTDRNGTIVAKGYGIPENGMIYIFTSQQETTEE